MNKRNLFKKTIFTLIIILLLMPSFGQIDISDPFYVYIANGKKYMKSSDDNNAINAFEYAIYLIDKRIKEIEKIGLTLQNRKIKDILLYYYALCNYNISKIYFYNELQNETINYFNLNLAKKELRTSLELFKQIYSEEPLYDFLYIQQLFLLAEINYIEDKKDIDNTVKSTLQELINWYNSKSVEYKFRFQFFYAKANFITGLLLRETTWDSGEYLSYIQEALTFSFREDLCHYLLYEYYQSRNNENRTKEHLNKALSLNENVENDFYSIFKNKINIFRINDLE